jgi:ubiquinone/menaquinone biosynthesis C-methylase UbiE
MNAENKKHNKFKRVIAKLCSPSQLYSYLEYTAWRLGTTFDRLIDKDLSNNGFTGLRPCIGNYQAYFARYYILQAVENAIPLFSGKLLDVGAGSSPYKAMIMASGNISDYIKLDFASSEYHSCHELDLTWDGKSIPLNDQSVDTVFMTEVLEHVHKPGEMLQEVRRVLKPNGILFLTVPFIWPIHELPYDYHRFTPIALKTYIEEASFDVQTVQLLGGWDHSMALQIGLWLTNSNMGNWRRRIAKLAAWPLYSYLMRKGKNENTEVRNHQMHIGLAAVAIARERR